MDAKEIQELVDKSIKENLKIKIDYREYCDGSGTYPEIILLYKGEEICREMLQ